MAGGKIQGSDFVDQSAHEEFKKLTAEAEKLVKSFVDLAGGANAFREALSKSEGIKGTTDAIKNRRKELTEMEKLQKQVIDTNQRIVNMETQMGKAVVQKNLQLQETRKRTQEEIQATKMREGSYAQLDLQLKQMVRSYKALSEAERNAAKGTELLKKIQDTRLGLGALDATMGDHRRNVGNYATASMGLTQVLRELPAFTYSVQTGIMGISNNIPQLIDDFKRLRTEGNGFGGALGIMGKSMFSFTNIASIAIGVFTIFYKQIAAYVDSLNDASGKQKELNKVLEQGEKDARAQVNTAERLYRTTQDLTLSIEARKKAVDKLQETYPAYFANIDDEVVLNGDAKDSYDLLVKSIISAGRARALESKIQEEINSDMDKELQLRRSLQEATSEEMARRGRGTTMQRRTGSDKEVLNVDISPEAADALRIQKKAIAKKELDDFKQNQAERLRIYEEALMKEKSVEDNAPKSRGGETEKKNKDRIKKSTEEIKKEWESGLNAIDREIQLMNDEVDKATIERVQKSIEKRNELLQKAAEEELNLIRDNIAAMERMWDQADQEEQEKLRRSIERLEMYGEFAQQLAQLGETIADIAYQREINQINARERRMNEYYDAEKARITASYTNKQDQEREMLRLEAQREAQQKKIDQDRRTADRKRAQSQKAFDIASIITATALAVIKAYTEGDPYTKIPRALAAASAGAISLARAIAAPIPQYAEGTENHPGGPAIVGEKGVELVQEPGGKSYLTPSTATLMNLPARTKVIPHEDLIAAAHAAAYRKMAEFNGPVNTSSQQAALIEAYEELAGEMRGVRQAVEQLELSVTFSDNAKALEYIKSRKR